MKKSKFLALISMVLLMATVLTLFSGCGKDGYGIKDVIASQKKTKYQSEYDTATKMELLSAFTDAKMDAHFGDLVLFKSTKDSLDTYTVYNAKTMQTVATYAETKSTDIYVSLYRNYDIDLVYYTVSTTTYKVDENDDRDYDSATYATDLYVESGAKIATANYKTTPNDIADLIYFDGKVYGKGDGASLVARFDYSPLASIPSYAYKVGKYYYGEDDGTITVYNSKLKVVSRYTTPDYISYYYEWSVLENGNVLIQYKYLADENAADYTYLEEDEGEIFKYNVVTLIMNYKDGSTKTVKTNYLIDYLYNYDYYPEDDGAAPKYKVQGYAALIENQRITKEDVVVYLDKNGNFNLMDYYQGSPVEYCWRVSEDRWIVETEDGNYYLLDKKGKLIGDITNSEQNGNYIYSVNDEGDPAGKIYDLSLKVIFDIAANKLTFSDSLGDSLLFTNADGETVLYTGGSTTTVIIPKDSKKELVDTFLSDTCYVIENSTDEEAVVYEIYNHKGTLIHTIPAENLESYYFSTEMYSDDFAICSAYNESGETVYYRLSF